MIINQKSSNKQIVSNENYVIINEIIKSMQSKHKTNPDYFVIANTTELFEGAFSHGNTNHHMEYLKSTMFIQQHLFWKK